MGENIRRFEGEVKTQVAGFFADVSGSMSYRDAQCYPRCPNCHGSCPQQVCAFKIILTHLKTHKLNVDICGAWGGNGKENMPSYMGLMSLLTLLTLFTTPNSKGEYPQSNFGTYFKYLGELIMCNKDIINCLVIMTDGEIVKQDELLFLNLLKTINLPNLRQIVLIFTKNTTQITMLKIVESWKQALHTNEQQCVEFEHHLMDNSDELLKILCGAKQTTMFDTPEGHISMFNLFSCNPNTPLREFREFFEKYPDIHIEFKNKILKQMTTDPSLFDKGDKENIYTLAHKILRYLQEDKEYDDDVSKIKAIWEDKKKKNPFDQNIVASCAAFQKLLDSTRMDESRANDLLSKILNKSIGTIKFKIPIDVNLQTVLDALKDGSGYLLSNLVKQICTRGAPPLFELQGEAQSEAQGMIVLNPETSTPKECVLAIATIFKKISSKLVIPTRQIYIVLLSMLSSDALLPEQLLDMLLKVFEDPRITQDMFGISGDGKFINLPDNLFSYVNVLMVYSAFLNYGERIFKNMEPQTKTLIRKHMHEIYNIYLVFNALCKSTNYKDIAGKLPISAETKSSGFTLETGCLALVKHWSEEPWINIPNVVLVVGTPNGGTTPCLFLDQENFTDNNNENGIDTHRIKKNQLTPISSSLISGHSSDPLKSTNLHKIKPAEINPADFGLLYKFLPHEHPIYQIHKLLCGYIKTGEKNPMSDYSRDAPLNLGLRKSNDDDIRKICKTIDGAEPSKILKGTVGKNVLFEYLVAKLGLSEDITKLLLTKGSLTKEIILKILSGEIIQQKAPTDINIESNKLDPDNIFEFQVYWKSLQIELSKIRQIYSPEVLSEVFCANCQDTYKIVDTIPTTCHHFICKECNKENNSVLTKAKTSMNAEDKNIPIFVCRCLACNTIQPTGDAKLDKLLCDAPLEGSEYLRYCSCTKFGNCTNPYKTQLSCGANEADIEKNCSSCIDEIQRQLGDHRSRKSVKCPGCPASLSRDGGCDFVRCSKCTTEFCYGCQFVFEKGTLYDWKCTTETTDGYGAERDYNDIETSTCADKYANRR